MRICSHHHANGLGFICMKVIRQDGASTSISVRQQRKRRKAAQRRDALFEVFHLIVEAYSKNPNHPPETDEKSRIDLAREKREMSKKALAEADGVHGAFIPTRNRG